MNDLTWTVDPTEDGGSLLRLVGSITETADFAPILDRAAQKVRIDLSEVVRINSSGVREWIGFIGRLSDGRQVALERCAPCVVQQLNMIVNARGSAEVVSIMLPYFCGGCEASHTRLLELPPPDVGVEIEETATCPACGGEMEFDELPETYLAFRE